MVRTTKKPKSAGKAAKSPSKASEPMVANVNKSPRMRTRSKSSEKIAQVKQNAVVETSPLQNKCKRKLSGKVAFDEMVNPSPAKRVNKVKKGKKFEANPSPKKPAEPVKRAKLSSQEESDDEDSGHDYQAEMAQANQEKLAMIDQEMKQKMLELEQLMVSSGLTESAKILERCMGMTEKRSEDGPGNKNRKSNAGQFKNKKKKLQPEPDGNTNDNHHRQNIKELSNSQSEETIYHNAVEKRNSSSSDGGMDSSNELINLPFVTGRISDEDSPPVVRMERRSIIPPPLDPQPSGSQYK